MCNNKTIWYSMQTAFPWVRNITLVVHCGLNKMFEKESTDRARWINYTIWDENECLETATFHAVKSSSCLC